MTKALEMPAANGETVTEGHARICRERGHATHLIDGVVSPFCARCGGPAAPVGGGLHTARCLGYAMECAVENLRDYAIESRGLRLDDTVAGDKLIELVAEFPILETALGYLRDEVMECRCASVRVA